MEGVVFTCPFQYCQFIIAFVTLFFQNAAPPQVGTIQFLAWNTVVVSEPLPSAVLKVMTAVRLAPLVF